METVGKELFEACYEQPQSLERIQSIIGRVPDAIKSKDDDGRHPLYYACARKAELKVIQALVQQLSLIHI